MKAGEEVREEFVQDGVFYELQAFARGVRSGELDKR
jgi:hypothetical protein